jgi:hypothetical protein
MGASLFLVVGPVNIGSLFGAGESSNASGALLEQAEKVERKVKKEPENADLLLNLTKARISAGNAMAAVNSETGAAEITSEGRVQLAKASEAWSKYLKATKEPTVGGAQLVAPMLFSLAQTAHSLPETEANVRAAAQAQKIVAEQSPSLGSLGTLAIYQLYSFDYVGAKQSQKEAEKFATSKFARENLGNELHQIEKRAHEFQKRLTEANKEAQKARAKGEPGAANPLSGNTPLPAP